MAKAWFSINLLFLNVNKTHIHFSTQEKPETNLVASVKFLYVDLDCRLRWDTCIIWLIMYLKLSCNRYISLSAISMGTCCGDGEGFSFSELFFNKARGTIG